MTSVLGRRRSFYQLQVLLSVVFSLSILWVMFSWCFPSGSTSKTVNELPSRSINDVIPEEEEIYGHPRVPLKHGNLHVFQVYVYNAAELSDLHSALGMFLSQATIETMSRLDHVTTVPDVADIFVVLCSSQLTGTYKSNISVKNLLRKLPYWNGGHNHIIINLPTNSHDDHDINDYGGMPTSVMIAQSTFRRGNFRTKLDLITPVALDIDTDDVLATLPQMTPARREYMISFWGEPGSHRRMSYNTADAVLENQLCGGALKISDVDINCVCGEKSAPGPLSEWQLCSSSGERRKRLSTSTFTILPSPTDSSFLSTITFQTRLVEALQTGSIPVVIGRGASLPFEEIISWRNAVVFLSDIGIEEVRSLLMLYNNHDIFEMRRSGRILWTTYMNGATRIIESVLLAVRMRSSHYLSLPAKEAFTRYNGSMYVMSSQDHDVTPTSSASTLRQYQELQLPGDPFHRYDSTPFQSPWTPDLLIKDQPSNVLFRGRPAVGNSYRNRLGGNFPAENVTVVMIMFNRLETLATHVKRLRDLAFIERILILWDTYRPLTELYTSLDSNGKLRFIRVGRNSLNNRFLPFDLIQTEAVLMLDDDMMPSASFLSSGLRLWRQNRERIVGMVSRTILWKDDAAQWEYYQHPTCEYAMVLTPIMFIHKYYLFLYTNQLPAALHGKVDELMNCEDIAMNFLVAHVTRKPPLKIGFMRTLKCEGPGCENAAISRRQGHYARRSHCLQFFTKLFGYMPLLFSQSATHTWSTGNPANCHL